MIIIVSSDSANSLLYPTWIKQCRLLESIYRLALVEVCYSHFTPLPGMWDEQSPPHYRAPTGRAGTTPDQPAGQGGPSYASCAPRPSDEQPVPHPRSGFDLQQVGLQYTLYSNVMCLIHFVTSPWSLVWCDGRWSRCNLLYVHYIACTLYKQNFSNLFLIRFN